MLLIFLTLNQMITLHLICQNHGGIMIFLKLQTVAFANMTHRDSSKLTSNPNMHLCFSCFFLFFTTVVRRLTMCCCSSLHYFLLEYQNPRKDHFSCSLTYSIYLWQIQCHILHYAFP
jgi:hypothetical protein